MKSLVIIPLLVFGVLAGATPIVNAQNYAYPYTNGYAPVQSCTALTAYQQLGSTDASTGGQVTILQEILNRDGYLSGVSGTFDEGTYGAVVNYQRAHGIEVTGIVGSLTLQDLNQESCGSNLGTGYGTSYGQYGVGSGSSCSYINGEYVCSYASVPAPIYTSGYGNCGNTYGYYSNTCNVYNPYSYVRLNSFAISYNYSQATVTVTGTGFTPTGNTVYFGNSVISNATSYNGTTLVFVVPAGYYTGTYGVSVRNASGMTSNTLQFAMNTNNQSGYCGNTVYNGAYVNNGSNCYNNGYYGNGYNNVVPVLSAISGPSTVSYNSTNTWTLTSSSVNGGTVNVTASWGDGSTSVSNTQSYYSGNGQTYSFTHTYLTPGTYTLRVTATNSNGLTSYQTYNIYVTSPVVYGNNYNTYYSNGSYQYSY